jgi:hypothetical protein
MRVHGSRDAAERDVERVSARVRSEAQAAARAHQESNEKGDGVAATQDTESTTIPPRTAAVLVCCEERRTVTLCAHFQCLAPWSWHCKGRTLCGMHLVGSDVGDAAHDANPSAALPMRAHCETMRTSP